MIVNEQHLGSNFDDFLDEEGLLQDTEQVAIKRMLALRIQALKWEQEISKLDDG